MQFYDRRDAPLPRWFSGSEAANRRQELLYLFESGAERVAQTSVRRSRQDLGDPSIREGLERLFHGRCSFCEARAETRPYRFRPPAEALPLRADGTSHLYYAWLAESWENIYAICNVCAPEEPDLFPVIGDRCAIPDLQTLTAYATSGLWPNGPPIDKSVFLNPCVDKNFHFHFQVRRNGVIVGIGASKRGRPTIDFFNFNNPMRVEERARVFADRLDSLLMLAESRGQSKVGSDAWEVMEFNTLPFGGAWYLYLRRVAIELKLRINDPSAMSRSRLKRFFIDFVRRQDAFRELSAAISAIDDYDDASEPVQVEIRRVAEGAARLAHVEIRNFKGVERLEFSINDPGAGDPKPDRPAPALLILGENAAGKSTIIEAIAMAMSDKAALQQLKIDLKDFRLDPSMMGRDGEHRRAVGHVTLRFDDGGERTMDLGARGVSSGGRTDLPPVFAYGAFRQYNDKTRRYSPARAITTLFRTDATLSKPERWLLKLGAAEFDAVVRTLRSILAIDQEFEVVRRDDARERCVVVTATSGPTGAVMIETPFSQVSSGFRSVLAMVCDVLEGLMHPKVNPNFKTFATARGVLLIDEIEAHLHPRWKMQIMRGLRSALPQMTIIATTHDPLCLRGMEDGEVMVLHRIAGEETDKTTLPVFVEMLTDLPGVNRLTVQQLLTSDFFSLFSTDSPEAEGDLAQMADLLAARASGRELTTDEATALRGFETEISSVLPVGSTEVQRLVQSAVAEYLRDKRGVSRERLLSLKDKARASIIKALETI